MAQRGDSYEVTLKPSHLKWGEYRYTGSRDSRELEGYIPIPREYSLKYQVLNSNGTEQEDIYGKNLFNCRSADGLYVGVLKSQGSSTAGDIYAKQFSGFGDLQALGKWYESINAEVGDKIRITWMSPTDIVIEKL